MKWFQHLSEFHTGPKGRKILRKYGVEGVGIWWITCELVAKDGIKYRIKREKDWLETLLDITKVEKKHLEEVLKFFGEINSIDKKALNVGQLYIPKMKEYASNWVRRTENLQSTSVGTTAKEEITLDKITLEEKKLIFNLKDWNECQSSPIQNFKPENIIKKHGVEKIQKLLDQYGKQNNGFSGFLQALKS